MYPFGIPKSLSIVYQKQKYIIFGNYSQTRNYCKSSVAQNAHDCVIVLDGRLARLRPLPCPVYSDRTSFFALFSCLAIGYALKTENGRGFLMLRSSRSFCISAAENDKMTEKKIIKQKILS